jgi:ribosomal protein L40E
VKTLRYCPKCGAENTDDAEFCKSCGEDMTRTIRYTKPRDAGWGAARVAALVIGAILVFTSLGLIIGGGSLRMVQSTIVDSEGYIMSGVERLSSDSYAIVFEDIDIEIDADAGPFREWFRDLITVKITATNNDPVKNVFLGIADYGSAYSYLGDVSYHRLIETDWEYDPWGGDFPDYTYSHHGGDAPAAPPTVHSFWAAFAAGSSRETVTWSVAPGRYWVVVMNEDASQGVDVDLQIGAKVPILKDLGDVLLTVGVLVGLVGAAVIYYGAIKR